MMCPLCGSFLHHSFITEQTGQNVYYCTWSAHQRDDHVWVQQDGALCRVKVVKVGGLWEVA
jgi:hypothetical protein